MTQVNHTPGPWGLTAEGLGFSVRSAGTKENGYSSEHICSMDHYRYERMEFQSPNARLIAAAPDMLKVLKFLRDNYDVADVVDPIIAKATGDNK